MRSDFDWHFIPKIDMNWKLFRYIVVDFQVRTRNRHPSFHGFNCSRFRTLSLRSLDRKRGNRRNYPFCCGIISVNLPLLYFEAAPEAQSILELNCAQYSQSHGTVYMMSRRMMSWAKFPRYFNLIQAYPAFASVAILADLTQILSCPNVSQIRGHPVIL